MKIILQKLIPLIIPYFKDSPLQNFRFNHTLRVLKLAEFLAKKEKANLEIIQFAAILHDIGKYKETKEKGHALISAEIALLILDLFNLTASQKEQIIYCIKNHNSHLPKLNTLEAEIIRDADKLDRLSPIRVALYFYNAPTKNRTLEETKNVIKEELSFVKNIFRTKTARKLSLKKEKLIIQFIKQFEKDWVKY